MKQCATALYKKNIQKLTKVIHVSSSIPSLHVHLASPGVLYIFGTFQTFLTLSLVDVAHRVGLRDSEEAEKYVRNMVSVCGVNRYLQTL